MTDKDVEVATKDEGAAAAAVEVAKGSDADDKNKDAAAAVPPTEKHIAHICNDFHPPHVRFGILIFLLGTFILLVFADFGSGVMADSIMIEDGEIVESNSILNVSVVSSVGKLWDAESYPLAIFIAITSIGWPYIKLALATVAWVTPYANPRRREFFIEIIDALGKWSFVDIMVLVEIMVAFRSSLIMAPGLSLEIVIVAQWGFYGFVIATMLSLASTHIILHFHREVHYHGTPKDAIGDSGPATEVDDTAPESGEKGGTSESDDKTEEMCGMKAVGNLSSGFMVTAISALVVSMIFFLAGVTIKTFEVTSTRGTTSDTASYSISSIGMEIPSAYIDTSHTGTRFIQFMWFFLGIATPLLCSALFLVLYSVPSLSKKSMEIIFTAAEITFAWSCAEVLFLSTIFAVMQMPVFGDGLVENNCATCFLITTEILPEFAVLCIGTIINVGVNVWLYRKAHSVLFSPV